MHSTAYDYIEYPPGKPLARYIKLFYYFQGYSALPERILPLGTTEISIRLPPEEPIVLLTNPGTRSYFVIPQTLNRIIGICLQPWGLYDLFHVSPGEITNSKFLLRDVLRTTSDELTRQIQNLTTPGEMISALRQYLLCQATATKHDMICDAIRFIDQHHGQIDLLNMYDRYPLSRRRLQQLFECTIGMSPKKYSQLKRFHFAVTQLNKNSSLTELALNTGYYDQPHFIHEFNSFAGVAPRRFLKESNLLNAINATTWFDK
jgi:AraC-like DNA-binding protein